MRKPCDLLLIDGDTLVYRYGLMSTSPELNFDAPAGPEVPPIEAAKLAISQKLQFLLEDTGVPDFRIALANPGIKCFRYSFYPSYKSHRKEPPEIIRPLRQWLRLTFADKLLAVPPGLPMETDDILGYHHAGDGSTCIVSNDKDFHTLDGWNYHPFTGKLHWITKRGAHLTLLYQMLVGDSADGFPGCPGIGPVKAEEILLANAHQSYPTLCDIVNFTFQSQGATEEDMLTMWCLANVSGLTMTPRMCHKRALPPDYLKVLEAING